MSTCSPRRDADYERVQTERIQQSWPNCNYYNRNDDDERSPSGRALPCKHSFGGRPRSATVGEMACRIDIQKSQASRRVGQYIPSMLKHGGWYPEHADFRTQSHGNDDLRENNHVTPAYVQPNYSEYSVSRRVKAANSTDVWQKSTRKFASQTLDQRNLREICYTCEGLPQLA